MGFSRQEYWSGLSFASPGDLPNFTFSPVGDLPNFTFSPVICGNYSYFTFLLLYNEFVIFSLSMYYGLFVYLFLVKCLFKSFAHLNFFCTCYWVVGVIYIFWVSVPYRIRFASIIAHCGLTFDSIDSVLWRTKVLIFFLFFSFIFISWRLITLQYCSSFCRTLTWTSHGFICVPHPEPPLPPPSPSHPSGSSQCTSPKHLSHASNLGWWSVSP